MNNPSQPYRTLKIKSVHEEVQDFKTIVFEEGHGIEYKAGQYLTLVKFYGKEEIRRSYSFTSSPALKEPMSIGVKRIPNGAFSRLLVDHAKPGDELLTSGAGGMFTLPEEISNQQFIFFAAGSGITPIYSLIKTLLKLHPQTNTTLVYSNSSERSAIFLKDLNQLQSDHPGNFNFIPLFSNNQNLLKARLNREMIMQIISSLDGKQREDCLCYICGPENYMRLCIYTLRTGGIRADQIRKENFLMIPVPKIIVLPPDKNDHSVIIKTKEQVYNFSVSFPDTILKAARRSGIQLPYSCETGRCGNCVARCTAGEVWHSYNEVLTERDLQEGLVLTCVGHPVGGDVVLEL